MLAHLRQVTLHAGHQVTAAFLSSLLTPLYVDRQQELVCLLHDELEQERLSCLLNLFSPARSHAPSLPLTEKQFNILIMDKYPRRIGANRRRKTRA